MAIARKSSALYIKLGSGVGGAVSPVKYAWRVKGDTLSGKAIRKGLGIIAAKDGEKGLVFGANSPKPARVRINFIDGGSTESFCDPSKVESLTFGNALYGKSYDIAGRFFNKKISSVTCIQG